MEEKSAFFFFKETLPSQLEKKSTEKTIKIYSQNTTAQMPSHYTKCFNRSGETR